MMRQGIEKYRAPRKSRMDQWAWYCVDRDTWEILDAVISDWYNNLVIIQ